MQVNTLDVADKRNKADAKWLQQVRRSGTASDKLAAMTLLIQVRRLAPHFPRVVGVCNSSAPALRVALLKVALVIVVCPHQESAVANLKSLDELLRWVGKRSGARAVAGQVTFDIYAEAIPNGACMYLSGRKGQDT